MELLQGKDGTAHLTYFDKSTQLSFVWDNTRGSRVAISVGGYAEPVDPTLVLNFNDSARYTGGRLLKEFEALCRDFVDEYEKFSVDELRAAAAQVNLSGYMDQILQAARLSREV